MSIKKVILGPPKILQGYIWDENIPSSLIIGCIVMDKLQTSGQILKTKKLEMSIKGVIRADTLSMRTLTWSDTLLYTHFQVMRLLQKWITFLKICSGPFFKF